MSDPDPTSLVALVAQAERMLDAGDPLGAAELLTDALDRAEAAMATTTPPGRSPDPDGDGGQLYLRAHVAAARVLIAGGLAETARSRLVELARDFGGTRGWRLLEAALEDAARASGATLDEVAEELRLTGGSSPGVLTFTSWRALDRGAVADAVSAALVASGTLPAQRLTEAGRDGSGGDGFLVHGGFVDLVDALVEHGPGEDDLARARFALLGELLGALSGPAAAVSARDVGVTGIIAGLALSPASVDTLVRFAHDTLPALEGAFAEAHADALRDLPCDEGALAWLGAERALRRFKAIARVVAVRELGNGTTRPTDRWVDRFLALNRPGASADGPRLLVGHGDGALEELTFDSDDHGTLLAAVDDGAFTVNLAGGSRSEPGSARPRARGGAPRRGVGARGRGTRRGPPDRGPGRRSSAPRAVR